MKTHFSMSEEPYDGSQLRSLYNYLEHGLLGDSAVAWIGPCRVSTEHMVDGEDLRAQERIEGGKMVHFILELFDTNLLAGVAFQRLLTSMAHDWLRVHAHGPLARQLRREGDDLFADDKKLSISIATVSPVSALIHFAVNVTNEGTPVETLSLEDLQADPREFAESLLSNLEKEIQTIREATMKVRWVK